MGSAGAEGVYEPWALDMTTEPRDINQYHIHTAPVPHVVVIFCWLHLIVHVSLQNWCLPLHQLA